MYKFKASKLVDIVSDSFDAIVEYVFGIITTAIVCLLIVLLISLIVIDHKEGKLIKEFQAKTDLTQIYETETRKYLSKFKINPTILVCDKISTVGNDRFESNCRYSTNGSTLSSLNVIANLEISDSVKIISWEYNGL